MIMEIERLGFKFLCCNFDRGEYILNSKSFFFFYISYLKEKLKLYETYMIIFYMRGLQTVELEATNYDLAPFPPLRLFFLYIIVKIPPHKHIHHSKPFLSANLPSFP